MVNCPYCGGNSSRVVDLRDVEDGIRRRRECLNCNKRFTTSERPARHKLFVIKRDHRRGEFNKEKLLRGLYKACEKRPLPVGAVDKPADDVESALYQLGYCLRLVAGKSALRHQFKLTHTTILA